MATTLESKSRRQFRDLVEREVRGPVGAIVGQLSQRAGELTEQAAERDGEASRSRTRR
jgi:hypothetical protein